MSYSIYWSRELHGRDDTEPRTGDIPLARSRAIKEGGDHQRAGAADPASKLRSVATDTRALKQSTIQSERLPPLRRWIWAKRQFPAGAGPTGMPLRVSVATPSAR